MPVLADRPGWHELRAVQHDRVFVADGNQYFNRPGPRIVESLEILAEIFHPEVFPAGHEGTGWKRYAGASRLEQRVG
jgi:iron complex transport system substrate-binding protein